MGANENRADNQNTSNAFWCYLYYFNDARVGHLFDCDVQQPWKEKNEERSKAEEFTTEANEDDAGILHRVSEPGKPTKTGTTK